MADTSYTKVKEIKLYRSGTIRAKFDLKSSVADSDSHGRIYFNGIAEGTDRSTNLDSYTTFSEDLTIGVGDLSSAGFVLVQLYLDGNTPSSDAVARNFRIYYTNIEITDEVITD